MPKGAIRALLRAETNERRWYEIKAGPDVAEVLIFDEIGFWGVTAGDFARDLQQITAPSILLRLNSPGGDVFDGLAIYNALRQHKAKVTAQIEGLAASIASIIALAADQVTAAKSSFLMIHNPWSIVLGDAAEMREMADILDKVTGTLADVYKSKSGASAKQVADWMNAETWFTAEEAVAAKFVDALLPEPATQGAAATRFDVTRFRNAPRSLRIATKITEDYKVGAATDLPIDMTETWDGAAAADRMLEAAGFNGDSPDSARAKRGFLCYDAGNPGLKTSYKLPFADFTGGELKAVRGGCHAAASRLPDTNIPDDVRKEARAVLDGYMQKMMPQQDPASRGVATMRARLNLARRRSAT